MPGITRSRRMMTTSPHTGYRRFGAATYTGTVSPGSKVCDDVIGNPQGENPLLIEERNFYPMLMNGNNGIKGVNYREAVDFPSVRSDSLVSHLSVLTGFKDPTETLANLHPGKPGVDILLFMYELKDLPSMLRHAASRARALHNFWVKRRGRNPTHKSLRKYYSRRHAGEDYLNYIFGWRPFFSDLADILDIHDYLEKRRHNFGKIRNNEIRTSSGLGSDKAYQYDSNITFHSSGWTVKGFERKTTTRERWLSARWRVDPIRYGAILTLSNRRVLSDFLGIGELPLTLWNALPWTWLVDWAVNVDSILSLQGNRQGVSLKSACVMDKTTTKVEMICTSSPSWLSVQNGLRERITKIREPFLPSLLKENLGLDILGPGQLATLYALKVTRGRGSSRF